MCGILLTNKEIKDLENLIYFLKKRGPDVCSRKHYNGFNFIHTLLSMTGKITMQPFMDHENKIIAMFNGEIYNYQEILEKAKPDIIVTPIYSDNEIYNHQEDLEQNTMINYSDGECIIPCYLKYGNDFVKQLDGEFCLVLCDFSKKLIYISTDIFSIKPLWLALEDEFIGISSYQSCLDRLGFDNIIQIPSNTTLIISMETMKIINRSYVITFDLRQYKSSFDDFNIALEKSIMKRTMNIKHKIFIGLSSGYDSGVIACALTKLNIDFTAYSIIGSEDEKIINDRKNLIKDCIVFNLSRNEFLEAREYLKNNCEEYKLNIDNGEASILEKLYNNYIDVTNAINKIICEKKYYNDFIDEKILGDLYNQKEKIIIEINKIKKIVDFRKNDNLVTNDNGAIGVSHICSIARPCDKIIYLSGSGADEIFSDYGFNKIKHFGHSTIGGYFPEDLDSVFPWKNFFGNTQRAYLMKEEYITGSYGIEGRYPFLDKNVVQEFLWLSSELKNKYYKSPLANYLTVNNYPFQINNKVGFNCGFGKLSFNGIDESYIERKTTALCEVGKYNKIKEVNFNNFNKKNFEETFFLDRKQMTHFSENCYICFIRVNNLGDNCGEMSNFKLYENNVELEHCHSNINDIKYYGQGRYLHQNSRVLYFSSSDNSNPLGNDRIYKFSC